MSVTREAQTKVSFMTSRFGPVDIDPERIISFVRSMPGFERLRRFILIDHDKDGLFKWLQAVDDPDVAFLMTNPVVYKPGYTVPLGKAEMQGLDVERTEDLVILVMVTVSRSEGELSLNLKGPVVFNSANMRAVQCIIDREDYPTQFMINH